MGSDKKVIDWIWFLENLSNQTCEYEKCPKHTAENDMCLIIDCPIWNSLPDAEEKEKK